VREIVERHGAEIDIFNNPRSHDQKFPGSLFRVTLRIDASGSTAADNS
jgi:two-component system sensor histidine kinase TctE